MFLNSLKHICRSRLKHVYPWQQLSNSWRWCPISQRCHPFCGDAAAARPLWWPAMAGFRIDQDGPNMITALIGLFKWVTHMVLREIHSLRQPKSIFCWRGHRFGSSLCNKNPLELQVSEETPFLDGSRETFHIKKTRSLVGGDVTPEKRNGSKWQLHCRLL